jgi:hypothetical protein
MRRAALACAVLLATAAPARAGDDYLVGLGGTTLAYRPNAGTWEGHQRDLALNLGYGRFVTPKLALELDLGVTLVRGRYATAAASPGLIWAFHRNAYAAARLVVPFDPQADLALFPGVGLTHSFGNGLAPLVELNLLSFVGRGRPDLGVTLTVGLLWLIPR